MKYELYMDLKTGPKVVATFTATSDENAWIKGQIAYDEIPSRNISVVYRIRNAETLVDIVNPSWV